MANLTCEHFNNDGIHCNVDWHRVPTKEYDEKCNYNYGKSCDYNLFITTEIIVILKKNASDPVYKKIGELRKKILEKDEKYSPVLQMYDAIGPVIANCIKEDPDKEKKAEEYYNKILLPISKLTQSKKYDIALDHYSYFTRILINQYGLNELYETLENKIEGYDSSICKKMKKTLLV